MRKILILAHFALGVNGDVFIDSRGEVERHVDAAKFPFGRAGQVHILIRASVGPAAESMDGRTERREILAVQRSRGKKGEKQQRHRAHRASSTGGGCHRKGTARTRSL